MSSVVCEAGVMPAVSGTAQCGSLPDYYTALAPEDNRLCAPGVAINFTTTDRGWERDCDYNYTLVSGCSAVNDIIPTGSISYTPDEPTQ